MKAKLNPDAVADAALLVPVSTIARALDLTPRHVQQLVAEGVIPKDERGRYALVETIRAYLRHTRAASQVPAGDLDPAQERARKDRALAIQTEMKNEQTRGELVPVKAVTEGWVGMISVARSRLLAIPSKAAERVLPSLQGKVFELVQAGVYAALNELAETEIVAQDDAVEA